MRSAFLPLAILLGVALVPLASAHDAGTATTAPTTDQTPGSVWIDGAFDIAQPDLHTLDLTGELIIREYVINGERYTADEIGDRFLGINKYAGRADGDAFIADVESDVTDIVRDTLSRSFPAPAVVTVQPAVVHRGDLAASSGNPYAPGVSINILATVARQLDVGDLSDDGVAAAFAAGARVASDFTLSANEGYEITYNIGAPADPAGLTFENAAGGTVSDDGTTLSVTVDNLDGASGSQTVTFELVDAAAAASAPTSENIVSGLDIRLGELTEGMTAMALRVDVTSEIHSVDVASRFPSVLPDSVTLTYLSADGMRALYAAGAISDDDMTAANDALASALTDNLVSIMPDVQVTGGLDEADLAQGASRPYATEPPVAYVASATGNYAMPEGSENADLALLIGATLQFDLDLPSSVDRDTTISVHAPSGAIFSSAEGGDVSSDKRSATFLVPADPAGAAKAVQLSMRDPDARQYTDADAADGARFGATVDLQDIDISIGKAIGGDMGNLIGEVVVTAQMGIFAIPEEFKNALPSNVQLEFLTSDAVRLLHARGVITAEQVSDLETTFRDEVTTNLANALQVAIDVQGGLATGTMDAAGITTPNGDNPITLEARAAFRKPLVGGAAPAATAATTLYAMQQSFTLPSVQGLATTYKVILPPGLAVSDLSVTGGSSSSGSENGREYFEVSPEGGGEATATMSIGVTPGFVIAKFWPVLLLAVLIVFLLVGTPIAFVVMRRRKRAAAEAGAEPAAETDEAQK